MQYQLTKNSSGYEEITISLPLPSSSFVPSSFTINGTPVEFSFTLKHRVISLTVPNPTIGACVLSSPTSSISFSFFVSPDFNYQSL